MEEMVGLYVILATPWIIYFLWEANSNLKRIISKLEAIENKETDKEKKNER